MKICLLGDTGSGEHEQYLVANAIRDYHIQHQLDAVLILGDNIYEHGVTSVDDPQFYTKFEKPYQDIDLPFHLLLGNHDYANIEGTQAFFDHAIHQLHYHNISDKWNMPQRYYSVKFGNCEFFMLDTNLENMTSTEISLQAKTMNLKIKKSKKRHKFLCGHHTWRSTGGHGNAELLFEKFMRKVVKGTNIKGYFCGHDHCKNHIIIPFPNYRNTKRKKSRKKTIHKQKSKIIHVYVVGTGGKSMDESYMDKQQIRHPDKLMHHDAELGFIILESSGKNISIQMITVDDTMSFPSYKNLIS
jgi:hypothetical protein